MRLFRCSFPATQELREGFEFMNCAFTAVGGRKVVERFSPWLGLPGSEVSAEVSLTKPPSSSKPSSYNQDFLLKTLLFFGPLAPLPFTPILAVLVAEALLPGTVKDTASITRSCIGFISKHGFVGSVKELREVLNLVKGAFEGITSKDLIEFSVAQLRN